MNEIQIYDFRSHRATYSATVSSSSELTRKSVFWFWNTDRSPAPGLAIVSYLGPAYEPRVHGNAKHTLVPYQRTSHSSINLYGRRHKERTLHVYQDEVIRADSENSSPRCRQQVAAAKFRNRQLYGLTDSSKTFNCAQVNLIYYVT